MTTMNSNALIIFIKNPVLGKVKTRLAKGIGDEAALEVYKELLAITRSVSQEVKASKYLYYADGINDKDDWSIGYFIKRQQVERDLGGRMESAFDEVLQEHGKVILVGSDCPKITKAIIDDAFEKLNTNDVVLGPSQDGGYYLIGLRRSCPEIFNNIRWSTDEVLSMTIKVIKDSKFEYALVEELNDIDTIEDLVDSGLEY